MHFVEVGVSIDLFTCVFGTKLRLLAASNFTRQFLDFFILKLDLEPRALVV